MAATIDRQEHVKVVATKLGPGFVVAHGTVHTDGKQTVTAAQLGLSTIKGFAGAVNNAGTGVGQILYSTTDMAAAVTTMDIEVIKDESTLVSGGQWTAIFWGDN